MSRSTRLLAVAGVTAALAVSSLTAATGAASEPAASPDGEILVISLNATEIYQPDDNDDDRDLVNFAESIAADEARGRIDAPDVFLLQEVSRRSARDITTVLNEELYGSEDVYRVIVDAGKHRLGGWHTKKTKPKVRRESAVVINTRTMTAGRDLPQAQMYLDLRTKKKHFREAKKKGWNHFQAATTRVTERSSGRGAVVTSTRMMKNGQFAFRENDGRQKEDGELKHRGNTVGNQYKGQWAKALIGLHAELVDETYTASIIGGDFNCGGKTITRPGKCGDKQLWKRFTETAKYRDSNGPSRIDQIFTKHTGSVQSVQDDGYKRRVTGQDGDEHADSWKKCAKAWSADEPTSGREHGARCLEDYYSDHGWIGVRVSLEP